MYKKSEPVAILLKSLKLKSIFHFEILVKREIVNTFRLLANLRLWLRLDFQCHRKLIDFYRMRIMGALIQTSLDWRNLKLPTWLEVAASRGILKLDKNLYLKVQI